MTQEPTYSTRTDEGIAAPSLPTRSKGNSDLINSFMKSASLSYFQPTVFDSWTIQRSMWVVRLGTFADAMSTTILWPNYAFLATPGATEDSFGHTGPFDFGGATYFFAMCALLGAAITSCFIGILSDRFGRRPTILLCVGCSVFWTLAKYVVRENFWAFCCGLFINGLFAGTLPVAMAYASDVAGDRKSRDREMAILVGIHTLGWRFGGVTTIILEDFGLFAPLFAGAFVNLVATALLVCYMIEPKARDDRGSTDPIDDCDIDKSAPSTFNRPAFANICIGSVLDAIGSNACFPLTMAPLAYTVFLQDYVDRHEEPIMSPQVYRLCYTLIGLMALVGSSLARVLYDKVGLLTGCIGGNVIAAVGPIVCLIISELEPTKTTMTVFMLVVYLVYPVAIMNQLGIGLMLDRISPVDHRGFSQGINVTLYNLSVAMAPFFFGILSDINGIKSMLWTVSGIAFLGGLAKCPLLLFPLFTNKTQSQDKIEDETYHDDTDGWFADVESGAGSFSAPENVENLYENV